MLACQHFQTQHMQHQKDNVRDEHGRQHLGYSRQQHPIHTHGQLVHLLTMPQTADSPQLLMLVDPGGLTRAAEQASHSDPGSVPSTGRGFDQVAAGHRRQSAPPKPGGHLQKPSLVAPGAKVVVPPGHTAHASRVSPVEYVPSLQIWQSDPPYPAPVISSSS